jgi:hypothetical protein
MIRRTPGRQPLTRARATLVLVLILLVAGCRGQQPAPTPTSALTSRETSMPKVADTSLPDTTDTSMPRPTETATRPAPDNDAANADVLRVRAIESADGTWTFHVTVEHPDTGWDDYADGWDVVTPEGAVLKPDPDSQFTRTLLHPHENEQPFTRSQGGIVIPEGVTRVRVRAHDLVDGFGGREVLVDLTAASGPDFEVEHVP